MNYMNYVIGGGLIAATGTSMLGAVAGGIAASSYNLLSYLWYGSETNVHIAEYHRRLTKLDIPEKLKLVDALLGVAEKKPAAVVMEKSIRETYLQIQTALDSINLMMKEHGEKWFSSYRNIDCEEAIKDLETHVEVLDKRLMLIA